MDNQSEKIRLQKFLADSGVASRRKSEEYILDGRIRVNGQIVTELGTKVDPSVDVVEFDDIEVVQMKKVQDAIKVYDSWDKQIYFTLDRTVCATYVSPEFYGDTSVEGIVYRSSDFDNATEVTDKATIERYFNNYRSQHSFIGDDGAFVQFMFKDGGNFIAYIPEKFV